MRTVRAPAIGAPLDRIDGPEKVRGTARYAFEQPVEHPAYLYPVEATIATGRIIGIDASAASAEPGVLAVLTHENAPRLASTDDIPWPGGGGTAVLAILQSDAVAFRGQFVGGVVAETSEIARHAASLVTLRYEERAGQFEMRNDGSDLYAPEVLNAGFTTATAARNVEGALASAAVTLDATYTTPMEHANPIELNTTIAIWTDDGVRIYCATQGVQAAQAIVAKLFGFDPQRVRVISPHVGGGFGCRCFPYADLVLTVLAAQLTRRPVKLVLTRQQMFTQVGYRPSISQRIQLGADSGGRLTAIANDVVQPSPRIQEYAEQTAIGARLMYAAPVHREGRPYVWCVGSVGRMINPKLGRSQLLGGMTWGISMALHEHSVLDPRFGHVVSHDFAGYHIATNADVGMVEVHWLDEIDPHSNPMGCKGIGELGIVGTAAAIANALHHATGIRVRDLPITLDKLLRCASSGATLNQHTPRDVTPGGSCGTFATDRHVTRSDGC
jgi:CO/xanthine dehydrogenase Mo-binding subunit